VEVESRVWDHIPFRPYVYRGTGVDTLTSTLVKGDATAKCKRCGYQYKTKHHREVCKGKRKDGQGRELPARPAG
jgi:hypothetical protein